MTTPKAPAPWTLAEDRALPADPVTRPIAREIYRETKSLPIISMHGHVPVEWFSEDRPFSNPAELLVVPDHYLVRMLVSQGARLEQLGIEPVNDDAEISVETDPRAIWRRFCEGWKHYRGTPTRFWLETELVEIFGVTQRPSGETADAIYDQIHAVISSPDFRPRALLDRFNIEVISTTDPAWASLADHRALAEAGLGDRILPTFRPDSLLQLDQPHWAEELALLGDATATDVESYAGYLAALRAQRQRFKEAGARASDHGIESTDTTPLPESEAARVFDAARAGTVTPQDARAFAGHMMFQMAAMAAEDGLVMQIHPGVLRNHDRAVLEAFGADKGYDIPVAVEWTRSLRPILEAFGHHPGFRTILFTIDEDTYSRELAPLAGVYPSVRLGAPWWFLDAPDAMRRSREAVTETAGFSNVSGFVDDTRAFASIPARHAVSGRGEAGYLGRLGADQPRAGDAAIDSAIDLAYRLPLQAYATSP